MDDNNHQLRKALYQLSSQANAIAEYMLHADLTLSEQLDKLAESILAIPNLKARLVQKLGGEGAARNATVVNADITVNTSISAEQLANLVEMIRKQPTGQVTPIITGEDIQALHVATRRVRELEDALNDFRSMVLWLTYRTPFFLNRTYKAWLKKIDTILGTKP